MASRGPNLNAVQVSAGILATLTGAIAASYLGVGGTLVGAAIGSVASTVGGEVYKHYLERTHERLRGAVDGRRYRTARSAVGRQVDPSVTQNRLGVTSHRREDDADAAETQILPVTRHRADDADAAETQILPVPRPGGPGQGAVTASRPASPNDPIHNAPTEASAAADGLPQAGPAGMAAAMAAAMADAAAAAEGEGKRPRWLVLTAITVGTFLIVVAVITVIELSVGKNLHAIVTNRSGSGTTVGGVIGGQNTKPTSPATKPAVSATPSVSPSAVVVSPTPPPASSGGATATPSSTLTPGSPNVPAAAATTSQ